MAAAIPIIALAVTALGTGYSVYSQQEQQKKREGEMEDQREWWEQNAYPKESEIQASRSEGRATLGRNKSDAYTNVLRESAARGFGAGSGATYGKMGGIEQGYLQGLGNLEGALAKMKGTPKFAPNQSSPPMPTAPQTGNPLMGALGYMAGKKMAETQQPQTLTGGITSGITPPNELPWDYLLFNK